MEMDLNMENTKQLKVAVDGSALQIQISICNGSQSVVWQRTWNTL